MRALKRTGNLDGLVFTMPHKAGALALVDEVSETGRLVGAINAARRDDHGPLAGRHVRRPGLRPRTAHGTATKRAAGARRCSAPAARGARSPSRWPEAGIAAIAVHDLEPAKAVALAADLARAYPELAARAGPPRPGEFDLLVNATPTGMRPDDPLPWPVDGLAAGAIVGDVTTKPEITPFLAAARDRGCAVVSGRDMVEGQLGALFRFFGFDVDPLA